MSRFVPARMVLAAGLAAVVVLSSCSAATTGVPAPASTRAASGSVVPPAGNGTTIDLPLPDEVANVPLTDENGQQFTLSSLKGRTIVLTDFLTACAEICPMSSVVLSELASLLDQAGHGSDVVVLEGTVDPARDTPSRLLAYKKLFGSRAALSGWRLFTAGKAGTPTLWGGLGVDCTREDVESPAPKDWLTGKTLTYDVDHQDIVFVIDAQGHERWLTNGTLNTRGSVPPRTLEKFLNDEGAENLAHPSTPDWSVSDLAAGLRSVTGIAVGG